MLSWKPYKPYNPYPQAERFARRKSREQAPSYAPVFREIGMEWVWGTDPGGRICAKTLEKKYVNGNTLLADVERLNADLEEERNKEMQWKLLNI